MISNFIFNFTNFCVIVSFFDKITNIRCFLFNSSISTDNCQVSNIRYFAFNLIILALRIVAIAKLVILSISFLTSFILALRIVSGAKLVISSILSSISLILALYASFLTTPFFTISLSLLNSIGNRY